MNILTNSWQNKFCIILLLYGLFTMAACSSHEDKEPGNFNSHIDTVFKHDTVYNDERYDWQQGFGLTHDPEIDSVWFRPVKYYLEIPECSGLASDFYYGFLRPSDNGTTDELLKLAVTNNKQLRPFYRWCLNKTIQVSDGALTEHVGIPARKYAEKFPAELFSYMQEDSSGKRYDNWAEAIGYSGIYENEDYRNSSEIRNKMTREMKNNCAGCNSKVQSWLEKFSKDCFP